MDQGVIESMKKNYKKIFLQKLLLEDAHDDKGIVQFFKKWTLYDTVCAVASAWDNVKQKTLSSAWKNLLGKEFLSSTADTVVDHVITNMLNAIDSTYSYSEVQIDSWLQEDAATSTCRELTDQEIVAKVLGMEKPVNKYKLL